MPERFGENIRSEIAKWAKVIKTAAHQSRGATDQTGRLQGRSAFITGAGAGIARVAALLFAREGANVAVIEINEDKGAATAQAVRDAGGDAVFIHTDITQEDSVKSAVTEAVAHLGKLDLLFNCAGGSSLDDGLVTEVDIAKVWNHTMSLDLLGTILCARHVVPEIIKAGGGTVTNMSSGAALRGGSPLHVYTSAKGAMLSLRAPWQARTCKTMCASTRFAPGASRPSATSSNTVSAAKAAGLSSTARIRRAGERLSVLDWRANRHREYCAVSRVERIAHDNGRGDTRGRRAIRVLNGAGPRRRAVALRLTDSSCRVIFGPRPARYAAGPDKENIMLDLVDPTIATARENIDYAARPTNLRGLRIGLIENTRNPEGGSLRKVAEKLRDNHGMTVEVMVHKAQRAPLKDAQIAEFKGKVDFVVSGVGD